MHFLPQVNNCSQIKFSKIREFFHPELRNFLSVSFGSKKEVNFLSITFFLLKIFTFAKMQNFMRISDNSGPNGSNKFSNKFENL